MRNRILIFTILIVTGPMIFLAVNKFKNSSSLISPSVINSPSPISSPSFSPTPSSSPENFNYDKTTNLKQTLQTVDPKIEDKNIEDLKQIIKSL